VLQYLRRLPALLLVLLVLLFDIEPLLAGVSGGEGKLRIPAIFGGVIDLWEESASGGSFGESS